MASLGSATLYSLSSDAMEEVLYGSAWNLIGLLVTTDDVVKVRPMRLAICSAALVRAFVARALTHSPRACHSRSKAIGLPLPNARFRNNDVVKVRTAARRV